MAKIIVTKANSLGVLPHLECIWLRRLHFCCFHWTPRSFPKKFSWDHPKTRDAEPEPEPEPPEPTHFGQSRSRSRSRSRRNGLLGAGAGAGAVKNFGTGSGSEKGYNCGKKNSEATRNSRTNSLPKRFIRNFRTSAMNYLKFS